MTTLLATGFGGLNEGEERLTSCLQLLPPGRYRLQRVLGKRWPFGFPDPLPVDDTAHRPYARTNEYGLISTRLTDASGRQWLIEAGRGVRPFEEERETCSRCKR